jgi:perosamine synthetase
MILQKEKNIINRIRKVIYKGSKKLHEPIFFGNEKKYLIECIDSSYVSSIGKFVNKFEKKLGIFTKSPFTVALINATSGIHLILKCLNISNDDEVLIPSLTFVATANAIRYCGAEPNFVDVEKKTFGICPIKLEDYLKKIVRKKNGYSYNKFTKKRIKVLIAVHVFGMPCDIQSINQICRKYNINVIEDAAEAIGSFYKKSHLGTNSIAGVISFNGNKSITAGNGAVILTKNKSLSDKIRHLSTQAKKKHKWEYDHDDVGFNYRLSNINAAIGCAQMEQIKKIISLKRKNFNSYKKEFKNLEYVELLKEPKYSRSNFWLISLIIKKKEIKKNRLLAQLYKSGIHCRPVWKPLHTLKIFKKNMRDKCKNAEEIYKNTINLPSSPNISL